MSQAREPRVVLLSMPWAALGEPSLGLGILKACLNRAGISATVRHCNLFLLRYVQARTYVGLANAYALNDFLFTYDLAPRVSNLQYRLARERISELSAMGLLSLGSNDPDEILRKLIEARCSVFPKWLDECVEWVAARQPTLVGLTCLFDQTMASVAVARRIRERLPAATIALGGYALEGPIAREILRCFPWIDAVCSGEGEPAIVELARASIGLRTLQGIPNLITPEDPPVDRPMAQTRKGRLLALRAAVLHRAPPVQMDDIPFPDFDDYFADLKELKDADKIEIEVDTLPVESSRGCWWGQKSHCVFCGIDDETMQYRTRSPDNTIAMLDSLHRRHQIRSFRFSDYILPYAYFNTLLPKLANRKDRYHLECEIKANLDDEKFRALKAAGFGECQPGIESFSTSVLKKMNKGVSGIQNIQTLVLGKTYGIRIHYNFLFGFPSDELTEYETMLSIIPLIYHLDPPHGRQEVEITRFAPLQADPSRFGIPVAQHAPLYDVMFPPEFLEDTGLDLDAYAYYFERPFQNSPALQRVYELLACQIDHWKAVQSSRCVQLAWWSAANGDVSIIDSRHSEDPTILRLGPAEGAVLRECAGRIRTADALSNICGLPLGQVEAALEELVAARLVIQEQREYLGLATPLRSLENKEPRFQRKWVTA